MQILLIGTIPASDGPRYILEGEADGRKHDAALSGRNRISMYACVDVSYCDYSARAACVMFQRWQDATASEEYVVDVAEIEPYVPGQFYRRELPCLLKVLELLPARPEAVVIDGYVWLNEKGRMGLGGHLFVALGEMIPVIGAAKTRFRAADGALEVFRGSSERPLLVTAAGMNSADAADCIRRMHGKHRIPTLLKWVDRLSRLSLSG